jgi:alanyl-tRNA synthetase
MGLERIAAVVQGVQSNYDTDFFTPIIAFVENISGKKYRENEDDDVSIRVIADHSRAVVFLIGDGLLPSNEGRGYVLRRILRRAARHGKLLGFNKPFLHEVIPVVIETMKDAYPDLIEKESYIRKVVVNEEQRFIDTLDTGLKILSEEVTSLKTAGKSVVPGEVVFKLYDTFGFPVDLTADIVKKDRLTLDMEGFEKAMEVQREKARESWKGSGEKAVSTSYQKLSLQGIKTTFVGYEGVTETRSRITAILKNDEPVATLEEGEKAEIFVEQTPFYGEAGGQVGDTGIIEGDGCLFEVWETQIPVEDLITHIGKVRKGRLKTGDKVLLKVDLDSRRATEAHHSGTHVLNAALRSVLGDHVKQSGSLVNPERLRFDFTHFSKIEDDELERIEKIANDIIRKNIPVETTLLPREEALKTGAQAVFDEKYGEEVRVIKMGDVSMELCGGTHATRTGDIGLLKVTHESAIAAGVRRIEAVAGREAMKYIRDIEGELKKTSGLLKANPLELSERVEKLLKHQKDMEKEIETLKSKLAAKDIAKLAGRVKEINGVRVLTAEVTAGDAKTMREIGDRLRDKIQSGIILLGSKAGDKAMLLCLVTKDLTNRYHAGNIIKEIAPIVGGSGGGRPDMAQAGGPKPENLKQALSKLKEIL